MSNNVSQSPNFHLSKTPQKFSNNKQVFLKNNNKKPTKRSGKSKHKTNNNDTRFSNNISNNNSRPMKVVHISNPMRYEATAAEFLALVQGLTGRDAVVDDDNFFGTHHREAAVEGHDDDHHHYGANNNSSTDNNSDDNNSSDDNNKVMMLHNINNSNHHYHQQQEDYYRQDRGLLSDCFGPSSDDHQLSFDDYYGAFNNGDFVVMEDHLRAFMGDDDGHQ